jgi:hypothetical protein
MRGEEGMVEEKRKMEKYLREVVRYTKRIGRFIRE